MITHARSDRALKSVCGDESGDWAPLLSIAPSVPPSFAVTCRRCLAILALAEREGKAIELSEGALFALRDDMGLKTLAKISDPPPRCAECDRPIQPDATHCPTCALGHVADAIGLDRDLVGGMMHSLVGNRDIGTVLMANFVLRHAMPAVPDPGPMRPRTVRSIERAARDPRVLLGDRKEDQAREEEAREERKNEKMTKHTITLALLLCAACGGEPFEPDLFGEGGAGSAGASGASGASGEGGKAGTESGGASGKAGEASGGSAGASDPCDTCKCTAPNASCPLNPANHCIGQINGMGEPLPVCCECPEECSLIPNECAYYPTSDQWCCGEPL